MSEGLVDVLNALIAVKGVGCLNRPDSWRLVSDYAPRADEADRRKAIMALKSGAFREFFVASDAADAAARLKMETFWGDDLAWDVVLSFAEAMGMDASRMRSADALIPAGSDAATCMNALAKESQAGDDAGLDDAVKMLEAGDYLRGYAALKALAGKGSVKAMGKLADMFHDGMGVTEDRKVAFAWRLKAAPTGSVRDMMLTAESLDSGDGIDKDEAKAAEWYSKAAELGDVTAMFWYARKLELGIGVQEDAAEAAKWYSKAAELGSTESMVAMGNMLSESDDSEKLLDACIWYQKAAGLGDSDAMYWLADMYAVGKGVAKDAAEARRWLEKAAGLGDEEAARKLAALSDVGMIPVKGGGSFTMGGSDSDNRPVGIALGDFMIGENEFTQALYKFVMGENPSHFKGARRPVERVSWYDAVEFCNKLSEASGLEKCYSGSGSNIKCDFSKNGYRLPTEAEWEYAAKGGDKSKGFKYSGSNNIDEVAWYSGNSDGRLHSVKQKQPNELGLYDMTGNVCEWCWDWYDETGIRPPCGPASGSDRVCRGGSCFNDADYCSVSCRYCYDPSDTNYFLGFRLARSAKD